MKRLIALDNDEFNALCATNTYVPTYQTVGFPQGMYYVFDAEGAEQIEKMLLLSACKGETKRFDVV